ncbi:MAG: nucleotidyltransferase [Actinomycetota bacterium]|nr:nucleotidyltransferase [Actinomycetota bacterium]
MTDPRPHGGVLRAAGDLDQDRFLGILRETRDRLEQAEFPYLFMGGLAVACLARPRWTKDIDVFVRPYDAKRALAVLDEAGYAVEETDPLWLFKATKDEVPVDIIFESVGGFYLDDEMLDRGVEASFEGERVRLIPPEDLLIIKASAHSEDTGYHWFDAIALLASQEIDWVYLLRRARRAVRRVLSLLVYAESVDVAVPEWVIHELAREVYTFGEQAPSESIAAPHKPLDPHVLQELRERLRTDPRVSDFDVDLWTSGERLLLTGEVNSAERRDEVEEVAAELLPGWHIDNRISVLQLDGTRSVEEVT